MAEELSFEEAVQELEHTVKRLEGEAISLEESLSLFERGVTLSRLCTQRLD